MPWEKRDYLFLTPFLSSFYKRRTSSNKMVMVFIGASQPDLDVPGQGLESKFWIPITVFFDTTLGFRDQAILPISFQEAFLPTKHNGMPFGA